MLKSKAAPIVLTLLTTFAALNAQSVTVPRTVRFNGSFHPADGLQVQPVEGVTVAVYLDQTGGDPLWQETQNVNVDAFGNFVMEMGATQQEGLPLDLLRTGEPRWVGVRVSRPGEAEQPRVRLLSVPYALRASDADTLGGIPASAYLLNPSAPVAGASTTTATTSIRSSTNAVKPRVTSGTSNYIGLFTNTTDLGNSVLYQNGGRIGLNTVNPLDYLHVTFNDISGGFTGYSVQNLGGGAASYSGTLFYDQFGNLGQFQGFNNSTHEYRINNIASNGSINFMLGSASKFQVRSDGDINISGSIRKGGGLFLHNRGSGNTAVGQDALGANGAGFGNTATGSGALQFNTTGSQNTAAGFLALEGNTTGSSNTAIGNTAIAGNGTGSFNTAIGARALSGGGGDANTATGVEALFVNSSGFNNAATGYQALYHNTSGRFNTATGSGTLFYNDIGNGNTATGAGSLNNNTTGDDNAAFGTGAMAGNISGHGNTGVGLGALFANTTGFNNAAFGVNSLYQNTTGSTNVAIGSLAGGNLTTGGNNIMIGNQGTSSDDHKIRVGDVQTSTYIAGIRGATTGVSDAVTVMIDSNGQLGTVNSSRRFKEDIQDMGEASSKLLRLRPVTYRYKQPYSDGSKPIDYGLIAEEVAEVYPDLVVKNKDGLVETVQYQKLTPMLLNELQKQNETIRHQQERIGGLEERLAALEALLSGSATSGPGR